MLFRELPESLQYSLSPFAMGRSVMRQCFAAAQTIPPHPSPSFYDQVRVLFHDLIVLFMRLIASKNEELSLLRSQSQCPVVSVGVPTVVVR